MDALDQPASAYSQRVDEIAALLQRKLPHYGLTEDHLKCLATTMAKDESSAVNAHDSRMLLAALDRQDEAHRRKSKLHVNVAVTRHQEAALIKLFPQFNLIFPSVDEEKKHHQHPLAFCARKIEYEILSRKIGKKRSDVTDIGGNYRVNTPYHCCCPVLSPRDRERYASREQDLEKELEYELSKRHPDIKKVDRLTPFGSMKGIPYHDFAAREKIGSKVRCFNKAQDCSFKSEYGICLHSTYDIKKEELADIMLNKGMSQLYGSMLWDIQMHDRFSGKLDLLETFYEIDPAEDKIRFTFQNDSSYMYEHVFSEYIRYGHDEEIVRDGVRFVYRVFDRRPGLIFFSMTRIPDGMNIPAATYDQFFQSRNTPAVIIKTFKMNYQYSFDDPRAYEPIRAVIPADVYDIAMKRFLSREDEAMTREQFFVTLRSNNVRFLINGKTYTTGERIDYEVFNAIVVAMMCIALREQHSMNTVTAVTLKQIDVERSLFNLGSLVVKAFSTAVFNMLRCLYDFTERPFKELRDYMVDQLSGKYERGLLEVMKRFTYTRIRIPGGMTSVYYAESVDEDDWMDTMFHKCDAEITDDQVDVDLNLLRALRAHIGKEIPETDINVGLLDELITLQGRTSESDATLAAFVDSVKSVRDYGLASEETVEAPTFEAPFFLPDQSSTAALASSLRRASFKLPENVDARTCTTAEYMQYMVAAISEAQRYSEFGAISAIEDAKIHYGRSVMGSEYCEDYMRAQINEKISPNFIHFDHRGRCIGSVLPLNDTYMVGMSDAGKIVNITYRLENGRKVPYTSPGHSRLFVYAQFCVYNGPKLSKCFKSILDSELDPGDFKKPSIHLVDGIAGCGKTTAVIDKLSTFGPMDTLVVSACREAADDARKKVIELKIYDEYTAFDRVRTIDSYLIHGGVHVKYLLIDEVFMAHPGFLAAVILKSRADVVWLYGDSCQIPFINRYSGSIETDFQKFSFYETSEFRSITHRCPVDVCVAVRDLYGSNADKVRTTSKIKTSLEVVTIDSPAKVPCHDDWYYMTFFQDEAQDLRKRGYKNVSTIHEAEGKTLHNSQVAIVRFMVRSHRLFDTNEYLLVGLTRHTKRLCYYTVKDDDKLSNMIRSAAADIGEYSRLMV